MFNVAVRDTSTLTPLEKYPLTVHYFLIDYLSGLCVLSLGLGTVLILSGWSSRRTAAISGLALVIGIVALGMPAIRSKWDRLEIASQAVLDYGNFPFDDYDVNTAAKICSNAETIYMGNQAWTAGVSASAGKCDTLHIYRGWQEFRAIRLPNASEKLQLFSHAGANENEAFFAILNTTNNGAFLAGVSLAHQAKIWTRQLGQRSPFFVFTSPGTIAVLQKGNAPVKGYDGATGELIWVADCPKGSERRGQVVNGAGPKLVISCGTSKYWVRGNGKLSRVK